MFIQIFLRSNMGTVDLTTHHLILIHICRAVTAKAQRKFAEDHTHIRMKEILSSNQSGGAQSAFEGPFGQRTQ